MEMIPKYHTAGFDLCLAGGAAVAAVLTATGLALWEKAKYMSDTSLHDKRTYVAFTGADIFGLCLFVTFCAMAVVGVYMFASTLLHKALTAGRDTTSSNAPTVESLVPPEDDAISSTFQPSSSSPPFLSSLSLPSTLSRPVQVRMAAFLYASIALAFCVTGVVAGATWGHDPLFTCGVIFCVGDPNSFAVSDKRPGNGLSFNATVGMMTFFLLVPMALVMAVRLFTLRAAILASRDLAALASPAAAALCRTRLNEGMQPAGMNHRRHRGEPTSITWQQSLLVGVLPVVVLLVCCAFLSFYLPNDTRRFIGSKIATLAMVRATHGTIGGNFTAPEVPGAWFRTRNVDCSEYLALKLFPGNVFFYVYLLLVVVAMWLLRLTVLGRAWLRAPVRWLPRRGWNYSDVLLSATTVLFTFLFFWYWVHDHNFKRFWSESQGNDAKGYIQASERWGRAAGQLATFFLSLLMFPASRSSSLPLFRAIGLSWESFLWGHRMLGYAMLIATLAHAVFFLRNFYVNGVLWSNLTSLPTIVSKKRVRNDFTMIPVTWATLLVLVSMGVFAYHPLRRRCFELFYYSHLIGSYVLFPVVLWHASSGWEYLLPGLTLWLLDRFIRLYRSGAPVEVLHCAVVDARTVRIDFRCAGAGGRVGAGQYVFLNVPELSLLQWHPFTTLATSAVDGVPAASSGDDTRLTVYIKCMGSWNTWTSQLYRRIVEAECERRDSHVPWRKPIFTLRVDGPCGSPFDSTDFSDYTTVYFVGGGIGVIPCAALYHSLFDQHTYREQQRHLLARSQADTREALKTPFPSTVKLIWICRSTDFVNAFAQTLEETTGNAEAATTFERAVFLTGGRSDWESSPTTASSPVVADMKDDDSTTVGATVDNHDVPVTPRRGPLQEREQPTGSGSSSTGSAPSFPGTGCPTTRAARISDAADADKEESIPATRRVRFRHGRPNWLEELDTAMRVALPADGGAARPRESATAVRNPGTVTGAERVLVFACGPSRLTTQVREVAESLGATFHREEFHL